MRGISISQAAIREHEERVRTREIYKGSSNTALIMIEEITRMSIGKYLLNLWDGRYQQRLTHHQVAIETLKKGGNS